MKVEAKNNMDGNGGLNRRGFIGSFSALVGGGFLGLQAQSKEETVPGKETGKITGYRTLGRTGFKVSDIGLGGVELTTPALVRAALDAGINYIDTAEGYLRGQSEVNIGKALKDYDRKKIFITTKLFFRPGVTKSEIKSRTLKCLERLQTNYVDCLMIHGTPTVQLVKEEGFHAAFKELKTEGKVRFCGLSNHGGQYREQDQDMEKIMLAAARDGRFDVALFAYNFLYREMGENILKVFKEKNIGATLMKVNPVLEHLELDEYVNDQDKEGKSVHDHTRKRLALYKERVQKANAFNKKHGLTSYPQMRDGAIKFVLSHPGVHTVTFSIKNFDQLEKYVSLSGTRLDAADKKALSIYEKQKGEFYCRHACGVCEPSCPHGVPVNTIMRYHFYFRGQGREKAAMTQYAGLEGSKPEVCKTCSAPCENACPYRVSIQAQLLHAHHTLTLS
jgi:aryl-alcohol dehydrogenase-like predicted oxidoreductase